MNGSDLSEEYAKCVMAWFHEQAVASILGGIDFPIHKRGHTDSK